MIHLFFVFRAFYDILLIGYDVADAEVQSLVKGYETLVAAEETLAQLKEDARIEQAKQKAADLSAKFAGIGEVTLESGEVLSSLRTEYDSLTDEENPI